ncbi:sulfite exporter TauE/SafE family protein [Panacibacter sp. DH6]|uniref:Sulfite exporter TauE/SafE family protein n=1 Tax=Panacibacter microcysteis TaxID=2793269 RepID=A0A931GZA2_9BACT|nr:sulfite exporter TauE/SafE family protein [Panacibacter microcysteis]MBG9378119.1 sulfite exporter TauE/SafE family protein [Panacibacter microcysteis]
MFWQIFISAFSIGLLSSFHCVGMCGAFAFSLPVQEYSGVKKASAILLYNLGRTATYAVLGLVFGLAGRQMYLGGFQQWFSVTAGIIIVLVALQSVIKYPLLRIRGFSVFNLFVQKLITRAIGQKNLHGILLLGMANGLLPCGLVYLAIAGALGTGSIEGASFFMAAFGIGTLPAMFSVSYFGYFIRLSVRNTIKKAMPWFIAAMGAMLIVRGMGLGIAYLSPQLSSNAEKTVSCHK